MMRRRKIGLIGRVDSSLLLFDGQTVKTQVTRRMLIEHYGLSRIISVDTTAYRKNPLRVLFELVYCLATCSEIVVLLSRGGRRFFFPILAVAACILRTNVYHILIGGALASDVKSNRILARYLNCFQVNWVETKLMADELLELGVRNAIVLPNCKDIAPILPSEISANDSTVHKFCTFSRVCEEKGISTAASAIERLNQGGIGAVLDVYGPVEKAYAKEFSGILQSNPYVSYKGSVPARDSVAAIKNYFGLLFPTTWSGEGIPGSVIDSLAAGVPVVASRWRYYSEILTDQETGFSYNTEDPADFEVAIRCLIELKDNEYVSMRHECLRRAKRYATDSVFSQVFQVIDRNLEEHGQ